MAKVTVSELAEATGKSEKTIYRYANSGKLAKEENAEGNIAFDVSEVLRVFPDLPIGENGEILKKAPVSDDDSAEKGGEKAHEIEILRLKLAHAEQERDTERERRQQAEKQAEEAREDYRQLMRVHEKQTALLPAPAESEPKPSERPRPAGFFQRIFGGDH